MTGLICIKTWLADQMGILTFMSAVFMLITVFLMIVQLSKSVKQANDSNKERLYKYVQEIFELACDYYTFVFKNLGKKREYHEREKYKKKLLTQIDLLIKYVEQTDEKYNLSSIKEYYEYIETENRDDYLCPINYSSKGIIDFICFDELLNNFKK